MPAILSLSLLSWAFYAFEVVAILLGWSSARVSLGMPMLFISFGYLSGAHAAVKGHFKDPKNSTAGEKDVSPDDPLAGNWGIFIVMMVTFGLTLHLVQVATHDKLDPILQILLVSLAGFLLMLLAHYRGVMDALNKAHATRSHG
jgi:hypothetical protein